MNEPEPYHEEFNTDKKGLPPFTDRGPHEDTGMGGGLETIKVVWLKC